MWLKSKACCNVNQLFSVNDYRHSDFLVDFLVSSHSHWYKAASFSSITKHSWRTSCKFFEFWKNLQNTHHAIVIIYKSYSFCFPSGARGMQWLSHHGSVTIGVFYIKVRLHIVYLHTFCSKHVNLNVKCKAQQKRLKTLGGSDTCLDLVTQARRGL